MENIMETKVCDFCGKEIPIGEGTLIVTGAYGCICEKCLKQAMKVIDEYTEEENKKGLDLKNKIKPSTIYNYLNQYIVGQDYAKKVLSVAVYNHYKQLNYNNKTDKPVEIDKSNVMLIGPTGSGKTFLIKTLSRMLNVPYAIADATSLTEAGYVGNDVEEVLKRLITSADGDIELAQKGIVYIDEIDKLTRKSKNPSLTKDVGGEGVQQALLKIIEGNVVQVPIKGSRRHPLQETVSINTSNILFIVGGSFEGIEEVIKKRKEEKTGIGFGSNVKSTKKEKYNDYALNVTADDLKNFGLIPEFIGRVPIICPLLKLTEKELCEILTEPKNALIRQYQQLIKLDNVELEFDRSAVASIAKKAIKKDVGARGLRSIVEKIMLPYMYDIPDMENLVKIIITKDCVEKCKKPRFIFKEQDVKSSAK